MGLPIVFGSQIQTVPIRTCACVYSPRQGTCSHHQAWLRKRLLLQRYFLEAVFHWWCCASHTRKIAFCGRQFPSCVWQYCFQENRIVPLVQSCCWFSRTLLHAPAAAERCPSCVDCALLLVFNKSLGTSSPIGPLLSRVIHRLIFSCRSPTPSAVFLLRSRAVWPQVFQLFRCFISI